MKINSIKLKNYRCFEELDVDFDERFNLHVIIAPNMVGKSALLKGLRIAASSYLRKITTTGYKSISAEEHRVIGKNPFTDVARECSIQSRATLEIYNGKNWVDEQFEWKIYRENNARVKTKFENTTALNLDKSVLNTFDRVIEKHEKNLPVFLYVGTEYIHQPHAKTDTLKEDGSALQGYWYCFEEKSMESYVFDWLKKMNETREEQKEKINASILYDELPSIFLNNFEYIIQQIFPDEIVSVQWIKNFKERQTRGKIDGKKIATQHSIDYILTFGFKNGEVRTYEMLSDGYRYLVLLAGELITRCVLLNKHLKDRVAFKTNGIVLIDEFGIHLHPELQTAALNRICTTFPNIQFIITTHSPLLLNNLKREQVHILEIDENNNRTIKNPDNDIVGLGAEGILKELFGLPTTLDTTSQKWASDYKELFLTKNEGLQLSVEQSKLFKELEAKLMTIDPGIIIKTAEDPLYTRFKERLNELESFHLTKQNGLSNDEMDKILSNIISSK